jgi:hypothetical protein
VELATHVRPASNLDDLVAVEPVGAGIAVSLQEPPERPKMVLGALTLTIGRVAEQHRRWAAIAGRAVVARIHSRPVLVVPRPGASTGTGVSSICSLPAFSVSLASASNQRLQQGARAADPVRQCRALQFHALAGIDRALPIQQQVIGILGHQHRGEQAGAG